MRFDLKIIASWIEPGSTVLDLGCGTGELMAYLRDEKQAKVTGIDFDEKNISSCIEKGLSVIQGDITEELSDYPDQTFDYIILSQTLMQVFHPDKMLTEMLRIGKRCVVSFPSFSYWPIRFQLFFRGTAPVSKELPYQWYDTPNIRVIPLKDFRSFCKTFDFTIAKEVAVASDPRDEDGRIVTVFPDFFAQYGIFMLGK
ncbi:MAG: methionine biosynthesis protein MetW [bacterium]